MLDGTDSSARTGRAQTQNGSIDACVGIRREREARVRSRHPRSIVLDGTDPSTSARRVRTQNGSIEACTSSRRGPSSTVLDEIDPSTSTGRVQTQKGLIEACISTQREREASLLSRSLSSIVLDETDVYQRTPSADPEGVSRIVHQCACTPRCSSDCRNRPRVLVQAERRFRTGRSKRVSVPVEKEKRDHVLVTSRQ